MAKAGFYLYGSRGKVGNLVARKGPVSGTILSERKFKIKNPQTNAQMAQRIILATVAQAAKFLSPIVDHSFQGKAIGARSKDYFRKVNMDRMRQLAANDFADAVSPVNATCFMTTRGVQALIPNSYIVAKGSLAPSKIGITRDDGEHSAGEGKDFYIRLTSTKSLPTTTGPVEGARYVTIQQLLSVIGLMSAGEQLTFVGIQKTGNGAQFVFNDDADFPGWMIPYTGLTARRVFVDKSVNLSTQVEVTNKQGAIHEEGLIAIRTAIAWALNQSPRTDAWLAERIGRFISEYIDWTISDNVLTARPTKSEIGMNYTNEFDVFDDPGYLYALGIIRSRLEDDGTWSYSNTILSLNVPTVINSTNFGLDWNSAIQAWFQGETIASNDLYLKAGQTQNVLGESFQ